VVTRGLQSAAKCCFAGQALFSSRAAACEAWSHGLGELNMTTASIRTTAFPTTIVQEISELIESSDVQFASIAALLDQFSSAHKDKISKLRTSAESGQKEFSEINKALGEAQEACLQAERQRDDTKLALARTQAEHEASQAELRSAQEELQRVRSELKQTADQLRNEETARLALETTYAELRYDRDRLNGIVITQHHDLKGLAAANKQFKRRIRNAAIAASVIVVVGLTSWLSGAHAFFLAAP
jgi:chromosome segregation ATPase